MCVNPWVSDYAEVRGWRIFCGFRVEGLGLGSGEYGLLAPYTDQILEPETVVFTADLSARRVWATIAWLEFPKLVVPLPRVPAFGIVIS